MYLFQLSLAYPFDLLFFSDPLRKNQTSIQCQKCNVKPILNNYLTLYYQLQNSFGSTPTCNRMNGAVFIPTLAH